MWMGWTTGGDSRKLEHSPSKALTCPAGLTLRGVLRPAQLRQPSARNLWRRATLSQPSACSTLQQLYPSRAVLMQERPALSLLIHCLYGCYLYPGRL